MMINKKNLAFAFAAMLLSAGFSSAQDNSIVSTKAIATSHAETNFMAVALKDGLNKAPRRQIEFIGNRKWKVIPEMDPINNPVNSFQDPFGEQSASQRSAGQKSPSPELNFNALNDNGQTIPPDVNGAVGTTHIMTTLNSQVRIQTRDGVTVSTVSLNSFFSSLSGVSGVFDPKVLYDHVANRWIICASSNSQSNSSSTLLAVSKSSDPTAGWNQYRVDVDPTNTKWVDYPSLGFNDRWIVVQMNLFPMPGQSASSHQIYVWDKADVYANGTGVFTKFDITNEATAIACPSVNYDASIGKMYTVRVVNGNSGGQGRLGLRTITGTASVPTLSGETSVSTTSTWGSSGNNFADFAPQLGSDRLIMANDHRIQQVVVRNGKIWVTHTVFLPASAPTRSAVQWWQLDSLGAVQQRSRIDDPTGVRFFAFPSVAVNKNDDALIGYASFSKEQYASASYSFRASTDPINTLRDEYLYKFGENVYNKDFGAGRNRWGDYSNTVVDPVNDTSFWTLQEYAGGTINTWATWWAKVTPGIPVVDFVASDNLVCPGQAVTFSDSSNFTGSSYSWTFTGGVPSSSTDANPTVTYSASGRYSVSLTVDGKTQLKDAFIIVATNPTRVINVANTNPCQGQEVTLTASQSSGKYLWNTGEETRSIKVTNSGPYFCLITAANGVCQRVSDTVNMVFNPLPNVTLDSLAPVALSTPAFSLTGGLPTGGTYAGPGVSAGTFDPSVAGIGSHLITYTFKDGNNCSASASRTINVGTVGVDGKSFLNNLTVNPNPANSKINIEFVRQNTSAIKLQMIDILGRVVLEKEIVEGNTIVSLSLDVENLKAGTYLLQLRSNDQVESKKIVIE